jgi:hypothetical protein
MKALNVHEKETEEIDSPAVSALRNAIAEVKQCWSVIGRLTKNMSNP